MSSDIESRVTSGGSRVHFRAVVEKQSNEGEIAHAPHEGRGAGFVRGIWNCVMIQEQLDAIRAGVEGCIHQGRGAGVVAGVDWSSAAEQRAQRFGVAIAEGGEPSGRNGVVFTRSGLRRFRSRRRRKAPQRIETVE